MLVDLSSAPGVDRERPPSQLVAAFWLATIGAVLRGIALCLVGVLEPTRHATTWTGVVLGGVFGLIMTAVTVGYGITMLRGSRVARIVLTVVAVFSSAFVAGPTASLVVVPGVVSLVGVGFAFSRPANHFLRGVGGGAGPADRLR